MCRPVVAIPGDVVHETGRSVGETILVAVGGFHWWIARACGRSPQMQRAAGVTLISIQGTTCLLQIVIWNPLVEKMSTLVMPTNQIPLVSPQMRLESIAHGSRPANVEAAAMAFM